MTEDERLDLSDLLPDDPILWPDEEELDCWPDDPWTYSKWRRVLGHERAHSGCCKSCGCCTSCMLGVFYESVQLSTIRELDKLGWLRNPEEAP